MPKSKTTDSSNIKNIADGIKDVVAEITKKSAAEIDAEKNVATLGIDSMKFLLLLQKINTKFKTKLSVEDLIKCNTINAVATLIDKNQTTR